MVLGGIHVKVLNNIFFHLIGKFRVLTQDDHMRRRRTTEERCCQDVRGWRIPQSLQSAEKLSGEIPSTKICLRTDLGLPALLPLSAMCTMKFCLRLLLRKRGTYFSVVRKIRAPANDLRLVSREPQDLFGPERAFGEVHVAVLEALI